MKVIVVGFGDGNGALVQDTGTKTYSHYCKLLLQHAYFICTIAICLFHCITIAACLFHFYLAYFTIYSCSMLISYTFVLYLSNYYEVYVDIT